MVLYQTQEASLKMDDYKRIALLDANESIPEMIEGYSLFSNKMVCAFEDKDLMAYTLKALSVLDVTEEMKNEMEISTEFWRKDKKSRGSKMDVIVKFPSKKIHIEIQRVRNKDEIHRAAFYMGKLLTNIPEGDKLVEPYDLTSVWICDFDPIDGDIPSLPYYHYDSTYKRHDGIYGCDGRYELGNGINYIFINCRFDWEKLDNISEQDLMLKEFMHDMKQSDVNNILHEEVSKVLSRYKQGGDMYDKYLLELREMHLESFDRFEEKTREEGREEGIYEVAKNLLAQNVDISIIESTTHLSREQILSLR